MKNYKLFNNVIGWAVFIVASTVYILTSEPTASFWDCGEYIATAYKLQVGHPPGAPTFQLIGRLFSLFAPDVSHVARMVNTMSALASGFTILFLFWSITMLAKKIVLKNGEMTDAKTWAIIGSGIVGALAYTFSDSFWFSAVEGEVYATSSFFTAIVFWAILKWEEQADDPHAVRWIILIAYLMGLSIGVHLLNLLAIPAITFVFYFKKYNPSVKGIIKASIAAFGLLVAVMYVIIPWVVKLSGMFELFFVNTVGLPFNWGTIIYFVLLIAGLVFGLRYARKKQKVILHTAFLCFTFILIGYSTFLILVIRSNAKTPINENTPKNAIALLAYLNREQYGDWPILYGQYYNAPMNPQAQWKDGNPAYARDDSKGKYVIIDKREKSIPTYDSRFCTIFPRMWSSDESLGHADAYKSWADIVGAPISYTDPETGKAETIYKPTFYENLKYFFSYQVGHMYLRYFLWNFAGKQNDIQNTDGNPLEGNWYSGIPFIDQRLGPQDNLPDEMAHSKAMNKFYMLPLILGFIGFFFHLNKNTHDSVVVMLLFFMTGFAILLYLNQYPNQPRERDYAYAASFYAFAIWIGLGVLALFSIISKYMNPKVTAVVVTLVCFFAVPMVMGKDGWNDHDRSGRTTCVDFATCYLNSCAPNAILFTNGDNDTFPLWYAQEVDGIRTDVRVVNLSLLNTDWYIDAMKRKAYDSDALPFQLTWDQYKEGTRDYVYFISDTTICPSDKYFSLKKLMDFVASDDPNTKYPTSRGSVEYFPTKNFSIPVDKELVLKNGTVPASMADSIVPSIEWTLGRYGVQKNSLMVLDLLANNNWKRPIYFAATSGSSTYLGLDKYLQLEGLAYRLVPVKNTGKIEKNQTGFVNTDVMYNNMMNKFKWGNMQDTNLYFDETVIGMAMSLRLSFSRLADALSLEGKKDSAVKVLDKCQAVFPERNVPYNYYEYLIGLSYYTAGAMDKGNKVMTRLTDIYEKALKYYFSFKGSKVNTVDYHIQQAIGIMQRVAQSSLAYKQDAVSTRAKAIFDKYYSLYSK
jgi:hypothetical protein